jgi:hypothetical protein
MSGPRWRLIPSSGFIKAAWLAWQATGDDAFIRNLMPSFERALTYVMEGRYFDREKYLFRRPYTIDTWDFAYTAGSHDWLQFQIDDNTFWGYFHGDNSGYYEVFHFMSYWYSMFGDKVRSALWRDRALRLRKSLNTHCFNGSFYTHFVKQTPVTIEGSGRGQPAQPEQSRRHQQGSCLTAHSHGNHQ